jgi:hypothetical protein
VRALVGTADARGLRLLFGGRFGPRYEMLATVELIEQSRNPDPGMGIVFGAVEASKFQAVWLYPKGKQGVRMRYEGNARLAEWPGRTFVEEGTNLLKFTIWDDFGELHVNGKGPCPFKAIRKWAQQPDALIGLSGTVWSGGKVRFTDITIRRITEAPERPG